MDCLTGADGADGADGVLRTILAGEC